MIIYIYRILYYNFVATYIFWFLSYLFWIPVKLKGFADNFFFFS